MKLYLYNSPPPPGYAVKTLQPEHAECVAKHWNLKHWFTEVFTFEQKLMLVKELISRFSPIGVFVIDNPSQPVSWVFRKPGK